MEATQYLDLLCDCSDALLTSALVDVNAPVPSCPGWTVIDLVEHMGGIWGWAAAIVDTGERADFPPTPQDVQGVELIKWAELQARQLIAALSGADPGSSCWTFGVPRSRLFWFRRQALETAVHAWDAERAVSHPEPISGEVASDGIDEFMSVVLPMRLKQRPGTWSGQSIHLHRTDGEGEWTMHLDSDAEVSTESSHGKADVALRSSASSLYLWCLNRVPLESLEVFGDRAVAIQWAAEIAF